MVEVQPELLQRHITSLLGAGLIRPLDAAFAQFMAQLNQHSSSDLQVHIGLIAAYLSQRLGEQDSCVELDKIGQPFLPYVTLPQGRALFDILRQAQGVCQPKPGVAPGLPLVLDDSRLYLQRYWMYEEQLASQLMAKAVVRQSLNIDAATHLLAELFPAGDEQQNAQVDWQKIAVCVAAVQQLSIITGGPGTGKTTTVTRLMALLQGLALQSKTGKPLKIQLVAPTGKAAARLSESILQARSRLPKSLQAHLPDTCSTIHRLLGAKTNSPYFVHNQQQPLHLDLLILDEASMVDLPLMSKLFAALPQHAQVVLLGDKDQLSSVEAGSVLSDICAAALSAPDHQLSFSLSLLSQLSLLTASDLTTSMEANASHQSSASALADNLVVLRQSHRFSADSGIGQLARYINQGDVNGCRQILHNTQYQDVLWQTEASPQHLVARLMPHYHQYFKAIKNAQIEQAFELLAQQQVLCAQRRGEWGVEQINALIESELNRQGLLDAGHDYYPGRPVMLSQNDHQLRLFNGDIGIVMADPEQTQLLKAWFINPQGQLRSVLLGRLPAHQTMYAMTIHKSQGSEFADVYLCLPDITHTAQARGLSRELLYTGLTRAKQRFNLYANQFALQTCLQQQVARGSGLTQRLINMKQSTTAQQP